ncbi:endo alpha-1,4 polygalactosaminidase [Schaalia hyovaginalis]|uniref:endo alpha-1,4 polygalactosaminidase n=1 Tax=Schaalia hyovaginalis TaxID=29316 RepID=UPI0026F2CE45|nr:endo alpha-1,4 polygalactosaminidase [Schaalia hyovaginalis]MDD7553686.1 endo alpha-1,4 polygalactosaminidase [Schaalia hyovaginalis]MDY3094230.1 endo alpha-1,4 polygalactosaminidase [Schaalia hyovaginalis]
MNTRSGSRDRRFRRAPARLREINHRASASPLLALVLCFTLLAGCVADDRASSPGGPAVDRSESEDPTTPESAGSLASAPSARNAFSAGHRVGVLLGIDPHDPSFDPRDYADNDVLILDLQSFRADQVAALRAVGVDTIYGYVSIGSLESYRPYAQRFQNLTFAPYENWPDERWIDVTNASWQRFITTELAPRLIALGADGFFVDNADVYAQRSDDAVYQALLAMIRAMRASGRPVMINGGAAFVERMQSEGLGAEIDALAQEELLTRIVDYEAERFERQSPPETRITENRLERARREGAAVLLIEYSEDADLAAEVARYARGKGFASCVSSSVDLRGD